MPFDVMDPTQAPVEDTAMHLSPAPRLDTLDGKVIGLWNNDKLNAAALLEMIRTELQTRYHFKVLRGVYDPARLMQPDEWGEIEQCDAVLLANGDCGACSTSGIMNAIELEARGIPAVLISTTPFQKALVTTAEMGRMPAIGWAVVGHPIASLAAGELQDRARDAARQLPSLMIAPD